MATISPSALPVTHLDTLSFVGLERSHLRSAVYRRVFGDDTGPVRIGRYSLLERIGAGARGVVFKAFDNQLDRLVALKVLSTRADDHEELIREAKALARLSHPNVLPVYEVGETEDGQVFLATEYVKGWTLRGWYDEETRGEAAIVEVIRQVARGVQAAHDEGLVHRDLKPANILLGEDGRVRVADFGLARFDPSALDPAAHVPRDGIATTTAGTPGYMAPELFRGAPASTASDQYALAVTLHELLFGSLPEETDQRLVSRGVTKAVVAVAQRGLSKAPEDRFPSVGVFADALVTKARSAWLRRMPWIVGAAALGGTVALGGLAATVLLVPPPEGPAAGNEVAMLRAQAALPQDPLAAVGELRKAQDLTDARLLPTAERALALGPEQARFELPEQTKDLVLLGSVLVFGDPKGRLEARRIDRDGLHPIEIEGTGLESSYTLFPGIDYFPTGILLNNPTPLAAIDPWALQEHALRDSKYAVSGDGRRVARILHDAPVLSVLDVETGEEIWQLEQPGRGFKSVSLDARGERLAWTERSGAAFILELATGVMHELDQPAADVLFEPASTSIVIRGRDSGVFRTDLLKGETVRLFEEAGDFTEVALSPGGEWVAARRDSDKITVTNLHASLPHTVSGDAFRFSPDGKRIAVRNGRNLEVHDLASTDVRSFRLAEQTDTFAFSDAQTLWAVSTDRVVRRFDVPPTLALRGHTASVEGIALSEDGSLAVSAARDYTVRVWDVDAGSGRVLTTLDAEPRTITLDERAGRVAITLIGSPTALYDLETGEPLGHLPSSSRPVLGPNHALIGAGKNGVWSDSNGQMTMLTTEPCSPATATASWVAAVCGDEPMLHVWAGATHTSTPVDKPFFGSSLYAWPDPDHVLFYGADEAFFRLDGGKLEREESPGLFGGAPYYSISVATNLAQDLIVRRPEGLYANWAPGEEPALLTPSETGRALAISGDGLRLAYELRQHQIVVRDRSVSKARPRLDAALQVAAATGDQP